MNSVPGDHSHHQGIEFVTAAPLIEALHENVALILEASRKTGVVGNRLNVDCFFLVFQGNIWLHAAPFVVCKGHQGILD